jgi:hypothetical protein
MRELMLMRRLKDSSKNPEHYKKNLPNCPECIDVTKYCIQETVLQKFFVYLKYDTCWVEEIEFMSGFLKEAVNL